MGGKYEQVLKKLTKLPAQDLKYQDKVVAFITSYDGERTPSSLALDYYKARERKEELEEKLKAVNLEIEAFKQLMEISYEVAGLSSVTLFGADGAPYHAKAFDLRKEPCPVVKNKDVYRQWCVDNGYKDQLQLWPSTTETIVKERLLDGKDLPDGVEAFYRTKIVMRQT